MYQLIGVLLCGWLMFTDVVLAEEEQIVMELTGNGWRTTRPFTVKDGWEVRWTATMNSRSFLSMFKGNHLKHWGIRWAMRVEQRITRKAGPTRSGSQAMPIGLSR